MRYLLLLGLLCFAPHKAEAYPQLVTHCSAAVAGTITVSCTVNGLINNDMIVAFMTSCGPVSLATPNMFDTMGLTFNSNTGWLTMSTTCNFRNHEGQFIYACVGA